MKKLTLYLRQKRLQKNMTLQDVARALGCSPASYSQKERCLFQFNVDEVKALSKILDIESEDIVNIFLA